MNERAKAPEFIAIPYPVFRDASLSPSAKLVYGRLKFFAGEDGRCFPKHETLAAEACLANRHLRNVLQELRAAGWISWTRTRTSCVYLVHSDRQNTADLDRHDSADLIGNKLPIKIGRILPIEKKYRKSSSKRPGEKRSTPEQDTRPGAVKAQTISQKKADDEAPATRAQLQNPEMEFRARLSERHGATVDAAAILRDVRADLGDVGLTAFLEAESKATTNPAALRNPHGHYRRLARRLARANGTDGLVAALETATQLQAAISEGNRPQAPRCTCADGALPGGGYCTCKTGAARRQLDEMRATA
jgi:Helix-turn-helix domain